MEKIFIDTSALVAFIYGDDQMHGVSAALIEKVRQRRLEVVATDYILDECVTAVLSRAGHATAVTVGDYILQSSFITLVWLDQNIKLKAWAYFKRHDDKGYSFTDCTSFALMREMKISRCISFDGHFKQAGFGEFS